MPKYSRTIKQIILVFSLAFTLNGCGTISSLENGGLGGDGRWGGDNKTILIYSGVCSDMGYVIWRGEVVYLLDMPFSFVADTIVLPYTITATAMGKNTRK